MSPSDLFLAEPAIHPRLLDPDLLAGLAEQWAVGRCMRIERVLAPGLAAELAPLLARLPMGPLMEDGFCWGCDVGVPAVEPQHPEPLYRAVRFVDRDLPQLVEAITGRALETPQPSWLRVRVLRKGSFAEPPQEPATGLRFVLGLTRARWPEAWGGHMDLLDPDEPTRVVQRREPGFDTLDLFQASPGCRTSLVLRHVEALSLRDVLRESTP